MYIVKMINEWIEKWVLNDWTKSDGKKVDNLDLVKTLYYYNKNLNITFRHIRSHKKEPNKQDKNYWLWHGNNMADSLAVNAANSI